MLFSVEWLRELCPLDAPVERIAAALTARGLTVDAVVGAGEDAALDVDVPANRPDCLGHFGLARELAAAFGVALEDRNTAPPTAEADRAGGVRVEIGDRTGCPRYSARVVGGVRVGPSPEPVVRRLERCGLRSVNNVVDASNLVLLELGHPVHFFDRSRLAGDPGDETVIRVHRARPDERFVTLDGIERTLDSETLVIADADRTVALAGIMGGSDSEISDSTTEVLIEAACFDAAVVRRAARRIGVATDASYRFERGVDLEGIPRAQALSERLLRALAGASSASPAIDVGDRSMPAREVLLRTTRLEQLLGFRPADGEISNALESLELPFTTRDDAMVVAVPGRRPDLTIEADVIEEVARHLGYDRIPTVEGDASRGVDTTPDFEDGLRDTLAELGFLEAVGYAMIAENEDRPFVEPDCPAALRLTDPIAAQLSHLRRSILPGLLSAADRNIRRGATDVRLFEIGRVFVARGDAAPLEPLRLGIAWSGRPAPGHWSREDRELDLYDLIGLVDHLAAGCGVSAVRSPGAAPGFHPGLAATWTDDAGATLVWAGALHPDLQAKLDQPLWLAEVRLGPFSKARPPGRFRPIPRFPLVRRDLSLVVDRALPYARILETLRAVPAPAPVRFEATDRFEGEPLDPGELSLSIRFVLEPDERTLTDPETEAYRGELVERLLQDLGARIRG